ncbi:MAG: SDR family oxidoreductase, partial [Pseudomonadota bacterium]
MKAPEGLSVLITGGGSGIGAETAVYLAEHGAKVTITGRREEALAKVAEAIGPACCTVAGDVAVAADRARMMDAAIAHGGGLDGLVNNAANMVRGPISELDEEAVREVFNTNVVAGMMLTGLAAPRLEERSGAVIFLGS